MVKGDSYIHWRTPGGLECGMITGEVTLAEALVWLGTKMHMKEKDDG